MNTKTLGVFALVGILGLGLLAGVAVAASPSLGGASSDSVSTGHGGHGMMTQGGGMMNGFGPHGTCTMNQTRAMNQTCTMDQVRAMNQTCDGQGLMNSYGPNGVPNGQIGNGPRYTDCPYCPCNNYTTQ